MPCMQRSIFFTTMTLLVRRGLHPPSYSYLRPPRKLRFKPGAASQARLTGKWKVERLDSQTAS